METSHDCKEELHSVGSKATPGRLAVLKVLEHSKKPLTAADVEAKVGLNQVTVYRILDALAAAGLARRGMSDRVAQYQYGGLPHHHHLVCADCGFAQNCRTC